MGIARASLHQGQHDDERPTWYRGSRRSWTRAAAVVFLVGAALLPSGHTASAGEPAAVSAEPGTTDFNGDGFGDLAVAAPWDVVGAVRAGSVTVMYGSAPGLTATDSKLWSQATPGVAGTPEDEDGFGSAVTAGDFDGDGFGDLAVGVPYEDVGKVEDAGSVHVIYGSASGLTTSGSQTWSQDSEGISGSVEAWDRFGGALTTADFDHDGFGDLAVGAAGEGIGKVAGAGSVHVIFGSAAGLAAPKSQIWDQERPGIIGASEPFDDFGAALAVGDFDGDAFADLAVGAPGEFVGPAPEVERDLYLSQGAVNVLYGAQGGLRAAGNQLWSQDSHGIKGVGAIHIHVDVGESFGGALASRDFDGDGFSDLAIGVRGDDVVGGANGAGGVNVIYGSGAGLAVARNQLWTRDSPGIEGDSAADGMFGDALAVADFDGDGFGDLAVGEPGQTPGEGEYGAGGVQLIYGSAAGLGGTGSQVWTQDSPGISDSVEGYESFGDALTAGDFDRDGSADLAVGVPHELLGPDVEGVGEGAVNVIRGSAAGLTAVGEQFWSQDTAGIPGEAEDGNTFGSVLAAGSS